MRVVLLVLAPLVMNFHGLVNGAIKQRPAEHAGILHARTIPEAAEVVGLSDGALFDGRMILQDDGSVQPLNQEKVNAGGSLGGMQREKTLSGSTVEQEEHQHQRHSSRMMAVSSGSGVRRRGLVSSDGPASRPAGANAMTSKTAWSEERFLEYTVCKGYCNQLGAFLDGIGVAYLLNTTAVLPQWYTNYLTDRSGRGRYNQAAQNSFAVPMGFFWDVDYLIEQLKGTVTIVHQLPDSLATDDGEATGGCPRGAREGGSRGKGAQEGRWRRSD